MVKQMVVTTSMYQSHVKANEESIRMRNTLQECHRWEHHTQGLHIKLAGRILCVDNNVSLLKTGSALAAKQKLPPRLPGAAHNVFTHSPSSPSDPRCFSNQNKIAPRKQTKPLWSQKRAAGPR
jgi:hypothetical protein